MKTCPSYSGLTHCSPLCLGGGSEILEQEHTGYAHFCQKKRKEKERVLVLLDKLGIGSPALPLKAYPESISVSYKCSGLLILLNM